MRIRPLCLIIFLVASKCFAVDHMVSNTAEFATALAIAQPGDQITLAAGNYAGGHFRQGLSNVTIRGGDPNNPPLIQGGINGIQLSDATNVTLEHLIFEGQTGNGLNIDDGGSFATPATDITIRNLTVRNLAQTGNRDGIKLSGVTGFVIDRVLVENWGNGGSAIDPVGSHNGLIQNSVFRHLTAGSSGVRPKGGSKNIAIYANRFEMGTAVGRAIQAGGSTGAEFFRFIDGDSGYEADEIHAAGNLIVGAQASVSWANIDGGTFHHNWIQNPGRWTMRILNENQGNAIVDTQNGVFTDNVIQYDASLPSWSQPANVGPETFPASYTFARNQWQNSAGATNINLPAPETDGQYGTIDAPRSGDQVRWEFAWGYWIVNASLQDATQAIATPGGGSLLRATAGVDGRFDPAAADPLTGAWTFTPHNDDQLLLEAQSQVILVHPNSSSAVPNIPGDYDYSGVVDLEDYQLWKQQFGGTGNLLADGNQDETVDLADYTVWRNNLGTIQASSIAVSEPISSSICLLAATCWIVQGLVKKVLENCRTYIVMRG